MSRVRLLLGAPSPRSSEEEHYFPKVLVVGSNPAEGTNGLLAHLGERLNGIQKARGSSPRRSTILSSVTGKATNRTRRVPYRGKANMPKWTNSGSGTLAVDLYREGSANRADNVLSAGRSVLCKSGDHLSAGELCTEVIARLQGSNLLCGSGEGLERQAVAPAIHNLRAGNGHHKAQGDHVGGNTCAQVIKGATG